MNYLGFATLYDALMLDAPYDKWVQFVNEKSQKALYDVTLLDVGCGTGELLMRLHAEGAHVTGVDLSAEMLAIAREKCELAGFHPPLFEQSMVNLEGLGLFDMITVFCDSLNYLETSKEVQETFQSIHKHLEKGGLFLFDVHSVYKIEEGFAGQTFAEDDEDVAYIWTSFEGEFPASVEHELTFFVKDDTDGRYVRMEELHKQRTYPIEQYEKWLHEANFKVLSITADFSQESPTTTSERIFFCARKK
ncbi:class I SAM-dependent methyltransferase [bacterium LRH843]|nr:class I SAM-dependent methyltransferase [bacterium LRH843]